MKKLYIIIAILLVATVALAMGHVMMREDAGGVTIVYNDMKKTLPFESLDQKSFSGTLINGKGESSQHDFRGVFLADVLLDAGFPLETVKKVKVVSEDSFSAELSVSEILQDGRVWLAAEDNGTRITGLGGGQGAHLIVFFEENSRRCVQAVEIIMLYE